MWLGLGLDTGRADLMQALLEGVAFRAAEVIDAMDAVQPIGPVVSIDGGMSRNPGFCRFLADTLGRDLRVSDEPELTALGIAALAAEGAGLPLAAAPRGRLVAAEAQPPDWRARFDEARQLAQAWGGGA
jgi:glycerol kinase